MALLLLPAPHINYIRMFYTGSLVYKIVTLEEYFFSFEHLSVYKQTQMAPGRAHWHTSWKTKLEELGKASQRRGYLHFGATTVSAHLENWEMGVAEVGADFGRHS